MNWRRIKVLSKKNIKSIDVHKNLMLFNFSLIIANTYVFGSNQYVYVENRYNVKMMKMFWRKG